MPSFITSLQHWTYPSGHNWTTAEDACIRDHDNLILSGGSITDCQLVCQRVSSFRCVSVELVDGMCHLSSDNQCTAGRDFYRPCFNTGGVLYSELIE